MSKRDELGSMTNPWKAAVGEEIYDMVKSQLPNYKEYRSFGPTNKERAQELRRRIRAKTNRERRMGKSKAQIRLEAFARRHGIDPFDKERPCVCCNGTGKQRLEKSFDTIHREVNAKVAKRKAERKSMLDKKFKEESDE